MAKFMKLLQVLEDPKHPCLGPLIRCLTFLGILHPDMKSIITRFKLAFFYLTIAFFISQYIKCLTQLDVNSLKLILQYAPFHMGVVKTCFFQKNHRDWERLISFISTVELHEISKKDKKQDGIISDYIKRSRKVTFFFFALAFFSNFSIFTEPYKQNQISENGTSVYVYMFDGYTPFARVPPGYYISMGIQTVVGHMMSACVVSWDMLVVSIMIFFAGQLRISRLFCERVIDLRSAEKNHQNIAECHQFHISLIKNQKIFNNLISPVMFIYLIVVCTSLGVCIIQIAEIENDLSALLGGCLYIGACLIQLLLFYWHANEVTEESELVGYSTFKSNWMDANKYVQKKIVLLTQATRKRLIFKAGPFNEMSLATFIKILRASYSFFTLLKSTN